MFQHLRHAVQFAILAFGAAWVSGVHAAAIPGQGSWESTLQARDLDHDGITDAYYDTSLNITWLSDAYADGPPAGFPPGRPLRFWSEADEWAHTLKVGGVDGWRLPSVINDPAAVTLSGRSCAGPISYSGSLCGFNSDTSQSELAHLFYVTLGNQAIFDSTGVFQSAGGLTNTGPFSDLRSSWYWTGTHDSPGDFVWMFAMNSGAQFVTDPFDGIAYGAWAVHDGDVAAVPEAETLSLAASGLAVVAMGVVLRRRKSV